MKKYKNIYYIFLMVIGPLLITLELNKKCDWNYLNNNFSLVPLIILVLLTLSVIMCLLIQLPFLSILPFQIMYYRYHQIPIKNIILFPFILENRRIRFKPFTLLLSNDFICDSLIRNYYIYTIDHGEIKNFVKRGVLLKELCLLVAITVISFIADLAIDINLFFGLLAIVLTILYLSTVSYNYDYYGDLYVYRNNKTTKRSLYFSVIDHYEKKIYQDYFDDLINKERLTQLDLNIIRNYLLEGIANQFFDYDIDKFLIIIKKISKKQLEFTNPILIETLALDIIKIVGITGRFTNEKELIEFAGCCMLDYIDDHQLYVSDIVVINEEYFNYINSKTNTFERHGYFMSKMYLSVFERYRILEESMFNKLMTIHHYHE